MAKILIKIKIMPEDINIDLDKLKQKIIKVIEHFEGKIGKIDEEEVAFGLKALNFEFMFDDAKTDSDIIEDNLRNIEGIGNVQIIDIRRAVG